MSAGDIIRVAADALYLAVLLAAPMVVLALVAGLLTSVLQAATQIHEPTLSFVPKLVAMIVALALFGPWIHHELVAFSRGLFALLPAAGGG